MDGNSTLVLMGGGFVLAALAAGVAGWLQRRRYRRWAAAGTEVEGTVVSIREYQGADGVQRAPLIEFCDRSGARHRVFGEANRGLPLEAGVRLVYDPADPESILVAWDIERGNRLLVFLIAVFGALGAGLLALGLAG